MAQVFLSELMESYTDYCAWVQAGKEDEDYGDDLLTTLTIDMQGYFFDGSEVDENAVMTAISEEDLKVTTRGTSSVGITLPNSETEGDNFIHWVTKH
jgi:hypothetical protein